MKINKLVLAGLVVGTALTLVADTVVYPRGIASEMSIESTESVYRWEAADECSEMEPKGTWRLPTLNELIVLCGSGQSPQYNCSKNFLWTTKRLEIVFTNDTVVGREDEGGEGAWLAIQPLTHEWVYGWYAKYHSYRCVK